MEESVSSDTEYDMFTLTDKHSKPHIDLNGAPVLMTLDTGVAISIINELTYNLIRRKRGGSPKVEDR